MPFSESLTVRILGDSSGLRSELDNAIRQIGNLQDRLSGISSSGDRLGRSLSGLASSLNPLQQISQWLTRITQQVQGLSRSSVTINVQPAIQALQQLMAAAQAAADILNSLSVRPTGGGGAGISEPIPAGGRVPRMAAGGLVTGPPGLDRVATRLTAGEFVLNQSAVEQLGMPLLLELNSSHQGTLEPLSSSSQRPQTGDPPTILLTPPAAVFPPVRHSSAASLPAAGSRSSPASRIESSTTNNHFGGITIQVRETADVNALLRDMRLQGIQLRNRRG